MSDFLSRVAARALGEAPVALPRVPALFEASAEPELEVVDEEIVVRTPPAARGEPAPDVSSQPEPTPGRSESRAAQTRAGRTARPSASPSPPTPSRDPSEPSKPSDTLSLGRSGAVDPRRSVLASALEPEASLPGSTDLPRAITALAAVAVPPRRAAPVAVPVPSLGHAAASVAREEQAPVRVHIGRLEVRAHLHEAPRPERRRAEPESKGLALSDYLRGRRQA